MKGQLTYQNFCTPEDAAAYKRVKRISMRVATVGREVACEMVGGVIGEGKEFVETHRGVFRLSLGQNADNSTEQAAHARMRAQPVSMGNRVELVRFFSIHGLPGGKTSAQWLVEVRKRLAA